jgi:hypothetical protein
MTKFRYRSKFRWMFNAYFELSQRGEPCEHVVLWYQHKLKGF